MFRSDENSKRKFEEQDVYVPWNLQSKFKQGGIEDASHSVVDEKKGVIVYQRYCHMYQQGELEGLVAQLPHAELLRGFYDNSNWFVWFKKTC